MGNLIYGRLPRLSCISVLMLGVSTVEAQQFNLSSAEVADSAALTKSMPRLAGEVLTTYRDTSRVRYLDNLFRLQLLTGKNREAASTLAQLNAARRGAPPQTRAVVVQYEIFAEARDRAARTGRPLAATFAEVFRETFARLDDRTAAFASRTILVTPRAVAGDMRWATPDLSGRTTISLQEALTLLRIYNGVDAYRAFAGLPAALV